MNVFLFSFSNSLLFFAFLFVFRFSLRMNRRLPKVGSKRGDWMQRRENGIQMAPVRIDGF